MIIARRVGCIAAAVALFASAAVVVAPPADAAGPVPWRFTQLTQTISVLAGGSPSWVGQCPNGYTPVSGGTQSSSSSIRRMLEYPSGFDGTYHVVVHNVSAVNLQATMTVLCAWASHVGDISSTTVEFNRNGAGRAGGLVYCPDNTSILSGGVDWTGTSTSRAIDLSGPTTDGNGWYAEGSSPTAGDKLAIEVRCVPTSQLAGRQVLSATASSGGALGTYFAGVSCAAGQRTLTGGTWDNSMDPATYGGFSVSTAPQTATYWPSYTFMPAGNTIRTVAVCVPASQPNVSISDGPVSISNDPSPSLTFTASDPVGEQLTFSCTRDGNINVPNCSPNVPNQLGAISDGSHTLLVQAANTSAQTVSASRSWTTDTVAPTILTPSPMLGAALTAPITLTFSEPVTGFDYLYMKAVGEGVPLSIDITATSSTTVELKPKSPLVPGTWYHVATVFEDDIQDAAGNTLTTSWDVRATTHVENSSVAVVESWDRDTSGLARGNAYIASRAAGSAATLRFSATAGQLLTVYGIKGADRGNAEVYLDGQLKATRSFYAATPARAAVYKTTLAAGEHTLQIKPLGTKSAASHGAWVALDTITVASTSYEESQLTQTFRRMQPRGASGSVDVATHAIDAGGRPSFAVTFWGTGVNVLATKAPDGGKAAIYVDGVLKKTVNLRVTATVHKVLVFSSLLSGAKHTLRIEAVGTASGARSSVRFDYLDIVAAN